MVETTIMLSDEEELKRIKQTQADYKSAGQNMNYMVPFDDAQLLAFHKYFKNLAQQMLGDTINLDKENIVFMLTDENQVNAAFRSSLPNEKFIEFTVKLIEFCENKDQLAFVLGHELGHFEKYLKHGKHHNNKSEETYCDLAAITKMVRAGLNIEQAGELSKKILDNNEISVRHLLDAHQSEDNRLTLLNQQIMSERHALRKAGKANNEVTGYQTHELEDEIQELVKNHPKPVIPVPENNLSDNLFYSEKYLKATYEEKVDMWFAQFQQKLSVIEDEENEEVYQISDVDAGILKKERVRLLEERERAKWGKNNFYFEEKFLEVMLNEKTAKLAIFKDVAYDGGMTTSDFLKFPREKFGPFIKEKFGNLRNVTDKKQAELMLANMAVIWHQIASRQIGWREIANKNLLDLAYNEEDIGKTFSKTMLNTCLKYNSFALGQISLDDFFKIRKLPNGERLLNDDDVWFLINNEGKIESVDRNLDHLRSKMFAHEVNEMVKTLHDIRDGKDVDAHVKWTALKQAWDLSLLKQFRKNDYDLPKGSQFYSLFLPKKDPYITFSQNSLSSGTNFNYNFDINDSELKLNLADLTPETKAFLSDKPSLDMARPDIDFIIETIAENIESEDMETANLFLGNVDRMLVKDIQYVRERMPQIERLAEVFFNNVAKKGEIRLYDIAMGSKVVQNIAALKLCQHLNSGKELHDFHAPFERELKDGIENFDDSTLKLNDPYCNDASRYAQTLAISDSIELLKDKPNVDLSKMCGDRTVFEYVGLIHQFYLYKRLSEEMKTVLKLKIKQEKNNPQNWGDRGEQDGKSFGERFLKITQVDSTEIQDVALYFYDQATIDDKINYFAQALGRTIKRLAPEEENTAVKNKIWQVIKKDFENKDGEVAKKTALFCKLSRYNLFDDNKVHYFEVLVGKDGKGGLLKEIADAPAPKFDLYLQLLDEENRIPDPDIRAEIIHKAVEAYWQENGKYNDISANEQTRKDFFSKIADLKKKYLVDIPEIDKRQFLRELAEITQAQKELAYAIKPKAFDFNTQDKKVIAAAYGMDALSYLVQNGRIKRETVMNYLLGNGSVQETDDTLKDLRESLENKKFIEVNKYFHLLTPQYLMQVKKEFDAAPLEGKAAIINLMSKGNDWEERFNKVADKLFAEAGELGDTGKKFLKAYISARPESERCFYLSAMYVAAKNNTVTFDDESKPYTKEQRSMAQGLRLFLENSGPAGVKLAQAMSSYAGVPDYIRDEMQNAKNNANPPARWEVFEWLEAANEEDALQNGKIAELLGSASFFVTYRMKTDDGKDKVIKIMRQGAKDLADAEFDVYKKMLEQMKTEFKGIESFKRLVDNAASMVDVETNLEIGEQQLRDAQKLYPKDCRADKVEFAIQVMDWNDRGRTWAVMEKAQGKDFKDLAHPYKKAAAKAIIVTELANMLSGKRFDSDRHSGQYKFDTTTNTIGVFDTGSISIVEPSEKEKYVLGAVLAQTVQKLMTDSKNTPASIFCAEIDKGIAHFYAKEIKEDKPIPPYLSEFQRGLLALTDFHKEIPPKELAVCVMQAINNGKHKLDPVIYKGFTETTRAASGNGLAINLGAIKTAAGYVAIAADSDLMTPETKMAQNLGRLVAAKVVEEQSVYGVLTEEVKSDTVVEVLSSPEGQIHFAKGVAKAVFDKIDPKNYDSAQKQQVGRLLYQVVAEGVRQKKLHHEVSLAKVFEQKAAQMPELGDYAKEVLAVTRLADKFGVTADGEMFKKAVMLGRLVDKDVQKGYVTALRESPENSFIRKALSRVSPLNFVPEKSSREFMNFVMKKMAPKCAKMIAEMSKISLKNIGKEHK